MKFAIAIAAAAGIATAANASITINELLASTTGTDTEFIELYNTSGSAVDLTNWSIELWDSDAGVQFGTSDAGAPYVLSGSIAAGGYYTLGNAQSQALLGYTADQLFGANSIENSSFTIVLRDAGGNVVETGFMTDGGAGDTANIAGSVITADWTFGPDGTFLPAGMYRVGDGNAEMAILEFDQSPASATAGAANIPAPSALALVGLGGLVAGRRRR